MKIGYAHASGLEKDPIECDPQNHKDALLELLDELHEGQGWYITKDAYDHACWLVDRIDLDINGIFPTIWCHGENSVVLSWHFEDWMYIDLTVSATHWSILASSPKEIIYLEDISHV